MKITHETIYSRKRHDKQSKGHFVEDCCYVTIEGFSPFFIYYIDIDVEVMYLNFNYPNYFCHVTNEWNK